MGNQRVLLFDTLDFPALVASGIDYVVNEALKSSSDKFKGQLGFAIYFDQTWLHSNLINTAGIIYVGGSDQNGLAKAASGLALSFMESLPGKIGSGQIIQPDKSRFQILDPTEGQCYGLMNALIEASPSRFGIEVPDIVRYFIFSRNPNLHQYVTRYLAKEGWQETNPQLALPV